MSDKTIASRLAERLQKDEMRSGLEELDRLVGDMEEMVGIARGGGASTEWSTDVDMSEFVGMVAEFARREKCPEIKFYASGVTIKWLSRNTTSNHLISPLSAVPLIRSDIAPHGIVLETRDGEFHNTHKLFDTESGGGCEQDKHGQGGDADRQ